MNRRPFEFLDHPFSRRKLFAQSTAGLLGVKLLSDWQQPAFAAAPSAKAKQVIVLMMRGAMSHIDTFDPKPGREIQGETEAIKTKTPGMLFGNSLPKLADLSEELAVIRSMTTETADHMQATYFMRTAYKKLNSINHPSMGAWLLSSMGKISKDLPGNVLIGNGNEHPNSGFLESTTIPVPIGDPAKGLENIKSPSYLTDTNFRRRLLLSARIDSDFRAKFSGSEVDTYNEMYREAVRLMGSKELAAFDIMQESESTREAYGTYKFGQGCLLARRLIQGGVRFVEVEFGSWDMHQQIFEEIPERAGQLDQSMSMLLTDLKEQGLLSTTMVVLATEFGRSPAINENSGRDHHPGVFSCVLAGAGIRGGQIYGTSDKDGRGVDEDSVTVADFNTTIAKAAGIDTDKEHIAPNGRPFKIGGGGESISKILA
ncbi:MAG: DUF1501 domain-containing protein [Pirellulaceae bacterium]|nr:DUF1501 domain-containing protein [Pirellulaceae bacterium]